MNIWTNGPLEEYDIYTMSIDKHLQDLESQDERVRKRAVLQLAQNVDMRAIPALMKVCKSDDSLEMRFYAKKALLLYRQELLKAKGDKDPRSGLEQSRENKAEPAVPGPATGSCAGSLPVDAKELKRLYGELESKDPRSRVKAIMALVQIKDGNLLSQLKRMDKTEDNPRVRAALVLAFGLLGGREEIGLVSPYLSEPDSRIRANAIESLKILGGVKASSEIAKLLKDEDRKIKQMALDTLKAFPEEELFAELRNMLSSEDVANRDIAAYALLRLEKPSALPLIVSALSDSEIAIRLKARNALVVLAKNGCEEAYSALSRHAGERQSPDSFMTMSVIERRPKLEKLGDPRPRERMKAVQKIVENEEKERVPELLRAIIREKDSYVRATIILALGQLKANEAVGTLKVFLDDDDDRIRANAVEALSAIGGKDVYPMIIPFLEDPNNRVRANAVVGLSRCPYIQLSTSIKKMIRSKEVLMRRSAIYAMVELRRAELIPFLVELADDAEAIVKEKAVDALKLLASEGFEKAKHVLRTRGID